MAVGVEACGPFSCFPARSFLVDFGAVGPHWQIVLWVDRRPLQQFDSRKTCNCRGATKIKLMPRVIRDCAAGYRLLGMLRGVQSRARDSLLLPRPSVPRISSHSQ